MASEKLTPLKNQWISTVDELGIDTYEFSACPEYWASKQEAAPSERGPYDYYREDPEPVNKWSWKSKNKTDAGFSWPFGWPF